MSMSLSHNVQHSQTNYRSRVTIEKWIIPQLVNKFSEFLEPNYLLPFSQDPETDSYPNQMNPVHNLPSYIFSTHLNIILLNGAWGEVSLIFLLK